MIYVEGEYEGKLKTMVGRYGFKGIEKLTQN
jgi:hypothetical protein